VRPSAHARAVLTALAVTFLWSTSWVLIKIGLRDLPPLAFAGLRYGLASLCLAAILWHRRASLPRPSRWAWAELASLGVLFYAVTQGAQFVALAHLPAATLNLILGLSPLTVALLGVGLLGERPTRGQWLGIGIALAGAGTYFSPFRFDPAQAAGFGVGALALAANAVSSILGRNVNRRGDLSPLMVTTVSMGIGAFLLLAVSVPTQGLPRLGIVHWAIVGWLAVVNTALAFTLWNYSLRTLSATESSVINNTMLIQIPILVWLTLGERLTGQEIAGLTVAGVGTLLVSLCSPRSAPTNPSRSR
jgi:drug/metabolite transporter (DMT)-like permease